MWYKRIFKKDKYNVSLIILVILIIIFVIPVIAAIPAILPFYNFSETGAIGDTLGGITSPFINGLAAILVYIAFKEQVKANKHFKIMEERKIIIEQINYLQNFDILQLVDKFESLYNNIGKDYNKEFEYVCGKLKVLMSEIIDLELQIDKFNGDNYSLKLKLKNIVTDLFIDSLYRITNIDANDKLIEDYVTRVNEILEKRNELTSRFFS